MSGVGEGPLNFQKYLGESMLDLIERAERFARVCHAGQCRKGAAKEPYTIHLEEVSSLVEAWGGSEEAIAAAWLHDTIEDCPPTSYEDLVAEFGDQVAGFVAELTDDKSLPKPKRKELQIENATKKTPEAALVKLADKTSNVGAIANSPLRVVTRSTTPIHCLEKVVSALPHCLRRGLTSSSGAVSKQSSKLTLTRAQSVRHRMQRFGSWRKRYCVWVKAKNALIGFC